MEILSVGQKIKRVRIYKGYTLKQICEGKFSVSKMSCIENDKIKAENWIIEHIAKKLDLDLDYLNQDVEKQLRLRLENLQLNKKDNDYEKQIKYNLKIAIEYLYYDIGLEIIHLLFNYYIDTDQALKCKDCIYRYYELFTHAKDLKIKFLYYLDIANVLYKEKEIPQAINYYKNVIKYIENKNIEDKENLIKSIYSLVLCYIKLDQWDQVDNLINKLILLLEKIQDDSMKARIYQVVAIYKLKKENDIEKYREFENKSYQFSKTNLKLKAEFMYYYSIEFFQKGIKEEALGYVERAIKTYPKEYDGEIVKFILLNVEILIQNGMNKKAQMLCDEALNYAIKTDDNKLIEKIYYYKAKMFEQENNLIYTEMYINLSLDILLKIGSKDQIYKRYLEMGAMYHKFNNVKESIKYFTLAIGMEKQL